MNSYAVANVGLSVEKLLLYYLPEVNEGVMP